MKLNREESWSFILKNSKHVRDKRQKRMLELLGEYHDDFIYKPAGLSLHHSNIGGLAVHTAQVLQKAMELFEEYENQLADDDRSQSRIRMENVYVVAVLHDLAKTQCYKEGFGNRPFEFNKDFKVEHDIWTISEANRFGLALEYEEMMGIMLAHGGWSPLMRGNKEVKMTKLAVLIHCADILSAQILKK